MKTLTHRCRWCNLHNPLYVAYHDREWGVPCHEDRALFELLILEGFQAGLSWECVLNKRESFRTAFDGFDWDKVAAYGEEKISALLSDPGIIRNRLKVRAAVRNAAVFRGIREEFGSFDAYLTRFTGGRTIIEHDKTSSELSDRISCDLHRRGMRFVGSTIIYAYLQAIGAINSHEPDCDLYPGERNAPSPETTVCRVTPEQPELWTRLADYARHCSWVAGPHVADMLLENRFSGWEAIFAAVRNGQIIGYCTFLKTDYYPENRYWPWISSLFVDETHRSQGVCGLLIDAAAGYARSCGFKTVYIPSDMTGFYERYGFRKIDELTNYGGDTDNIFTKDI